MLRLLEREERGALLQAERTQAALEVVKELHQARQNAIPRMKVCARTAVARSALLIIFGSVL